MKSRKATAADIDTVANIIALAFATDPVWGPALARADGSTEHLGAYWRPYVEGAVANESVFVTDDFSAVALWVPPGGTELLDDGEPTLERIVADNLTPSAAEAWAELCERFDANHPHDDPHAYLSLLATHPDHRGHGIAQQLMADNLADWEARGIPAYLESTNPANDHRYERAGFRPIGAFDAVLDDARITTMWRPVGG